MGWVSDLNFDQNVDKKLIFFPEIFGQRNEIQILDKKSKFLIFFVQLKSEILIFLSEIWIFRLKNAENLILNQAFFTFSELCDESI